MAYGATGGGYSNPGPPPAGGDSMTDGPMDTEAPKEDRGDDYEGATGILPKSLMAGKDFKVGEEIVLQITRIGEKDFEVKYASEEGGEDKGEEYEEKPD